MQLVGEASPTISSSARSLKHRRTVHCQLHGNSRVDKTPTSAPNATCSCPSSSPARSTLADPPSCRRRRNERAVIASGARQSMRGPSSWIASSLGSVAMTERPFAMTAAGEYRFGRHEPRPGRTGRHRLQAEGAALRRLLGDRSRRAAGDRAFRTSSAGRPRNLMGEFVQAPVAEGRASKREAILPTRLRLALKKLNPGLPQDALEEAYSLICPRARGDRPHSRQCRNP